MHLGIAVLLIQICFILLRITLFYFSDIAAHSQNEPILGKMQFLE